MQIDTGSEDSPASRSNPLDRQREFYWGPWVLRKHAGHSTQNTRTWPLFPGPLSPFISNHISIGSSL